LAVHCFFLVRARDGGLPLARVFFYPRPRLDDRLKPLVGGTKSNERLAVRQSRTGSEAIRRWPRGFAWRKARHLETGEEVPDDDRMPIFRGSGGGVVFRRGKPLDGSEGPRALSELGDNVGAQGKPSRACRAMGTSAGKSTVPRARDMPFGHPPCRTPKAVGLGGPRPRRRSDVSSSGPEPR
jgi:hypothetical protein